MLAFETPITTTDKISNDLPWGVNIFFPELDNTPGYWINTFFANCNLVNLHHLNGQTVMKHLPTVQHKV